MVECIYLLEIEFLVLVRIILESVLIAIKPITLLTDVGSCMQTFLAPSSCLLSGTAGSSTIRNSNTLGTFADESVTLLKSEYDSLIQKMH